MTAVFWVAGVVAVVAAMGVVIAKTPVHSVLALVVNFLALAVLYLSLYAEFIAVIQIIIYAGAIMVLFVFVIALLTAKKDPIERAEGRLEGQKEFGLVAVVGSGLLLAAVALAAAPRRIVGLDDLSSDFGGAANFGKELLTTHVFPFELTAFVLMAAVIGVVVLVGRHPS